MKQSVGPLRSMPCSLDWHEQLAQTRTSALSLRLANNPLALFVLTTPETQQFLGVTYKSAKNNIDKRVDAGSLRQVGDATYSNVLVAPGKLQIIGEIVLLRQQV